MTRAAIYSWSVVVSMLLLLSSCSSVRQVELSPSELQAQIRSGSVITAGDSVKVATSGGQLHELVVTAVSDEMLQGENISIPMSEIIALETRQFSMGRTAALVGSAVLAYQIMAAIAIAVTLGL